MADPERFIVEVELSEEELAKLEAIASAEGAWRTVRAARLPLLDLVQLPWVFGRQVLRSWWRRRFPRQSVRLASVLYRLEMRLKDLKGAR
jgi:hypothetical protein